MTKKREPFGFWKKIPKVDSFLMKAEEKIDWFFARKWHYAITFSLIIIALYAFYFIFCLKLGTTYTSKEGGFASLEKKDAALGWLIAFVCVVVLVYAFLILRHRSTGFRLALALIFIASGVMLYFIGLHNFNNGSGKHDFGAFSSGGHWNIIYDIFVTKEIPGVSLNNQYYQPKFFHAVYAFYCHFNRLFLPMAENGGDTISYIASNATRMANFGGLTYNNYNALESGRILLAFMGIMCFYATFKILEAFRFKGASICFPVFMVSAIPMSYFIVGYANNDLICYCLALWGLYYGILYYQRGGFVYPVVCALFVAGSMESKLSGAMIAIPIAILFFLRLVKIIKAKGEGECGRLLPFVVQMAVFAVVVFPLALGGHIYDYVTYGKPIGYVLDLEPNGRILTSQHIDNETYGFFRRVILYPASDLFHYIFNVRASMIDSSGALKQDYVYTYLNPSSIEIDYNIWTALIKHSLFEEWPSPYADIMNNGGIGMVFFYFAYYFCVVLGFVFILFSLCFIGRAIYKVIRRQQYDPTALLVMASLFIAMWMSYGLFAWRYPVECSMSSRYVTLIYLPIGTCIGRGMTEIHALASKCIGKAKEKAVVA